MTLAAHLNRDGPLEGLMVDDSDPGARLEPERGDIAQTVGLTGVRLTNLDRLSGRDFTERGVNQLADRSIRIRDRISVRIETGIAQRFRHALDQYLGHGVLETLSLLMDGFPTGAEEGDQVCLDDSVTADGAKSCVTTFERENRALVRNMLQQPQLREPLDHPAD